MVRRQATAYAHGNREIIAEKQVPDASAQAVCSVRLFRWEAALPPPHHCSSDRAIKSPMRVRVTWGCLASLSNRRGAFGPKLFQGGLTQRPATRAASDPGWAHQDTAICTLRSEGAYATNSVQTSQKAPSRGEGRALTGGAGRKAPEVKGSPALPSGADFDEWLLCGPWIKVRRGPLRRTVQQTALWGS